MKTSTIITGALMILLLICQACSPRADIIIRGATIADGSGETPYIADIAIRGDKILKIGDLGNMKAEKEISAQGYIAAPGFIDAHSHTDGKFFINPKGESKIRQGFTTEVTGNCGFSPFPGNKNIAATHFIDYKSYCDALDENGLALNQACLVGHGTLRRTIMGNIDGQPTAEQFNDMKALLRKQLDQGAWGMSTGLEYTPGSFATTEELIELSKILAEYDAVYASHMRNEDEFLVSAVEEAVEIGKKSGARVEISHFKACNKPFWDRLEPAMKVIEAAREEGLQITADRYPYNAYNTSLSVFLPPWARAGEADDVRARLNDPANDKVFRENAKSKFIRIGGADKFLICDSENPHWIGKTLADGMAETGLNGYDFIKERLLEDLRTDMIGFAMDERNLHKVLKKDYVMIGSDGSAYAPYGKLGEGRQHPRCYGTAPRVLGKYSREENLFDMATAVRKLSGMAAETFKLDKRGFLKEDYFADVVLFNPETVIDKAEYTNPHQYPDGIDYVIVNGEITIEKGEHTGALAGKTLRKTQ